VRIVESRSSRIQLSQFSVFGKICADVAKEQLEIAKGASTGILLGPAFIEPLGTSIFRRLENWK
jgi:hypothetical protein